MACPRDIDEWIELAKNCKYLTENDLKVVCVPVKTWNFYLEVWIVLNYASMAWG